MISCPRHARADLKRCYQYRSSAHRPYSSKVRAYPFVHSKAAALERMNWQVSLYGGEKILSTWLHRIFPSLNITGLQPVRVQATYVPTWIVDLQISTTVWFKPSTIQEPVKDLAHLQLIQGSMPGFVYHPLSSCNLLTSALAVLPTVPWSDALRKHNGEDVLCLPFSLSPLHLVDALRSLSLSQANISDDFRFDPSSVTESMMAAYPILLPGYLAEYKFQGVVDGDTKEVSMSAFMEAGPVRNPRVIIELGEHIIWFVKEMFNMTAPALFVSGKDAQATSVFSGVSSLHATTAVLNHHKRLQQWIKRAAVGGESLRNYRTRYFGETESVATRAVDWDDLRIRPWIPAEFLPCYEYISATEKLIVAMKTFEARERRRDTLPMSEQAVDMELRKIRVLESKREKAKPGWLEKYEDEGQARQRTPIKVSSARVGTNTS